VVSSVSLEELLRPLAATIRAREDSKLEVEVSWGSKYVCSRVVVDDRAVVTPLGDRVLVTSTAGSCVQRKLVVYSLERVSLRELENGVVHLYRREY
jgi:hypothetical protein